MGGLESSALRWLFSTSFAPVNHVDGRKKSENERSLSFSNRMDFCVKLVLGANECHVRANYLRFCAARTNSSRPETRELLVYGFAVSSRVDPGAPD